MRVALRPLGRAHAPLPQAHRRQALQVRRVREIVRAQRSSSAAHEATPAQAACQVMIAGVYTARLCDDVHV